jgi:hypothetical protein
MGLFSSDIGEDTLPGSRSNAMENENPQAPTGCDSRMEALSDPFQPHGR